MPRRVRNFWIEAEIDGRQTKLKGGPTSTRGGFKLRLFQRSKGRAITVVEVVGNGAEANLLTTVTSPANPDTVFHAETER